MVSLQSFHTIIPSEPTPNTKLFSLCEQIKLHTHAPLLYVYKPHHVHDNNIASSTFNFALQTLRNSLSQVLTIYYPLAGRLSWIERGQWELHCNAKGAQFLEAYCEQNLAGLGDFVPTQLVSQLIPNIDYNVPIEDMPLLAVQLTRFKCGGLTIGVAFCRATIDGTSAMSFMNTWARFARGENLDSRELLPCHDRTLLDSRKKKSGLLHFYHEEFYPPPLWVGRLRDTRVIVDVVKLTREQINKLKKKASVYYGLDNVSRPYSTFEVISGHLWRCVSKARYERKNGEQKTRLSMLVNCRNRLRPPLPSSYAGNAVFPTVTPTCSFDELMHKPLSYAIGHVREALERVNDEFVRSSLDHIANEKDMNLVRYNFHYPSLGVLHKGQFKGNPNLFVVSWMNFSYKDADFGWGEPVYFGPGYMDTEGKAFILNNANGDGFIVDIALDASHMDAFKKLFYEDIEEVFPTSKL